MNIIYHDENGKVLGADSTTDITNFKTELLYMTLDAHVPANLFSEYVVDVLKKILVKKTDVLIESEKLAKNLPIKIAELRAACEKNIVSGFTSLALGTEYFYKSERDDQLNLIGIVTAGTDDYYSAKDTDLTVNTEQIFSYKLHTITQLKQVLADGKDKKMACLVAYRTLKTQAEAATTFAELDSIVWSIIL